MLISTIVLLLALLIGVPVAFAIGMSALAYFLVADANLLVLPQQFIGQMSNLSLIAVPFLLIVFFAGGVLRALAFGFLYCIAPAVLSTAVFWCVGWAADNKSLDRSGGGVSCNIKDAAKVE